MGKALTVSLKPIATKSAECGADALFAIRVSIASWVGAKDPSNDGSKVSVLRRTAKAHAATTASAFFRSRARNGNRGSRNAASVGDTSAAAPGGTIRRGVL